MIMKSLFKYLFIYPELSRLISNLSKLLKKNGIDFVTIMFHETLDGVLNSTGKEIAFGLSKESVESNDIFNFLFDTYIDVYEIEFFLLEALIYDEENKINIQINKKDEIIIVSTNDERISKDIETILEPYKEYNITQKKDYLIYEVGMGSEIAKKYVNAL